MSSIHTRVWKIMQFLLNISQVTAKPPRLRKFEFIKNIELSNGQFQRKIHVVTTFFECAVLKSLTCIFDYKWKLLITSGPYNYAFTWKSTYGSLKSYH